MFFLNSAGGAISPRFPAVYQRPPTTGSPARARADAHAGIPPLSAGDGRLNSGETRSDRAVRLSGCDVRVADQVGPEIAAALPYGDYQRIDSGTPLVWYGKLLTPTLADAQSDRNCSP
jgi:hypothetical protein